MLEHYEKFEFARALEAIWAVIAAGRQISDQRAAVGVGEFTGGSAAQGNRALDDCGIVAHRDRAGASGVAAEHRERFGRCSGKSGTVAGVALDGLRWGQLAPGTQLGKAQTLFPRVDKTEAVERIEAMANEELNPTVPAPAPVAAPTSDCGSSAQRLHRRGSRRLGLMIL